MTTSMIERVAFRLFVRRGYTHAFGPAEGSWTRSVGTRVHAECMGDALAVLEELKHPTDAMIDAMNEHAGTIAPELAYQDAIEAALNEQVSG